MSAGGPVRCASCPVGPGRSCRGESAPGLCALAARDPRYRRRLVVLAHPEWLEAVAACPDRGPALPPAAQAACGCGELTGCRAGRGKRVGPYPSAVTLDDCLSCQQPLTPGDPP